jgi:hypothetical protein
MRHERRNHYDVTNRVRISHPQDVRDAVRAILRERYPELDLAALDDAFETFTRLYAGTLPGYVGCETWYHDAQHSLDCALAMARLLDGHEQAVAPSDRLGPRRCLLGVIVALFHDAGYVRHARDPARHGAEYTLYHVGRSGEFLAQYLPRVGLGADAELARHIVHFTGYEIELDKIQVRRPKDRSLGFLLGTADLLAQMADRCYLEKCKLFLYPEFEIAGLAGAPQPGGPKPVYASVEDLLRKTPEFNRKIWAERLEGYFEGAYRFLEVHFGGRNYYIEAANAHLTRLAKLHGHFERLDRRPQAINGPQLRKLARLKVPRATVHSVIHRRPPRMPRTLIGADSGRFVPA